MVLDSTSLSLLKGDPQVALSGSHASMQQLLRF